MNRKSSKNKLFARGVTLASENIDSVDGEEARHGGKVSTGRAVSLRLKRDTNAGRHYYARILTNARHSTTTKGGSIEFNATRRKRWNVADLNSRAEGKSKTFTWRFSSVLFSYFAPSSAALRPFRLLHPRRDPCQLAEARNAWFPPALFPVSPLGYVTVATLLLSDLQRRLKFQPWKTSKTSPFYGEIRYKTYNLE